MNPARLRLLSLVLTPLVLSAGIALIFTNLWLTPKLERQAQHYAQAMTNQLAITVTDHLIKEDTLGLNVLLAELTQRKDFSYAAVYGSDDRLLAQSGNRSVNSRIFTREVTFQNSLAGYVRVAMPTEQFEIPQQSYITTLILSQLALIVPVALLWWFAGDLLYLWATGATRPGRASSGLIDEAATSDEEEDDEELTEEEEPEPEPTADGTILVIKIRPIRRLPEFRERIENIFSLYGGQLIKTDSEDLVALFSRVKHEEASVCAARLSQLLLVGSHINVTIKLGMSYAADLEDLANVEKIRKQASYLASISENQILTSRTLQLQLKQFPGITCESFHSSLTPDGEVYEVGKVEQQTLLEQQAKQLLS